MFPAGGRAAMTKPKKKSPFAILRTRLITEMRDVREFVEIKADDTHLEVRKR